MPTRKTRAAPKKKAPAKRKAPAKKKAAAKKVAAPKAKPKLLLLDIPKVKRRTATQMPKRPGGAADLLYQTRATRLALQAQVEVLKKQETALKKHIRALMTKSRTTSFGGAIGNVERDSKDVFVVQDWEKVFAHIKKNNRFEMLQRRLATDSVREYWDAAGKRGLPGIKEETIDTFSITKA